MTLSFTLKIKFVVEIIIRKSCVANLLREFLIIKQIKKTWLCSIQRGEEEGELAVMSQELEFRIQCPLPSLTGCQFWPVSTGQTCRHQMYIKHMKDKFCMIEQTPENMAAARRWNIRKLLSSCFCGQVFGGPDQKTNIQTVANHHYKCLLQLLALRKLDFIL